MKNKKNFIIYTFSYNDDSGGTVVLHKLCHLLNQEGYTAKLWNNYKPVFDKNNPFSSLFKYIKYFRKLIRKRFLTNPNWNTPMAHRDDLTKESIVIYPEIISGNPLLAKNVVRWLLHKPGFHNGIVNYDKKDLLFLYYKAYAENYNNIDLNNILYIPNNREDVYFQDNFGKREGSCYILRKGKNREIIHELTNSVCIDGKKHEEIAKIFNKVEYCISYDTYTMYSLYAVLCGCKSIIVPEHNITKKEWSPEIELSYGLAYGFDDLEYAEKTKTLLIEKLAKENKQVIEQIHFFVNTTKEYFKIKE